MSTQIMGIINITPDSFSGDGVMCLDTVIKQASDFIDAGAHILDIGGQSTHPNAIPIDGDTELSRVIPVVREIRNAFANVTISIDTYQPTVAERAVSVGATMINDVWGGLYHPNMMQVARDTGVPICLMHNPTPWQFDHEPVLKNVYTDYGGDRDGYANHVKNELITLVDNAVSAGVDLHNIIADVGLGFGRPADHSMALLTAIDACRPYDCPLLIGPSRKGFIGRAIDADKQDTARRDAGTTACVAIGIASGADMVRVHNISMMTDVVKMTDALMGQGDNQA